MLSTFNHFVQDTPNATVRISVFYTRASMKTASMYLDLHSNIVIKASRPKLTRILESVIDRTCGSSKSIPYGLFVGACGPLGLTEQVRNIVGNVDSRRAKEVGGLELCEE